MEGIKAMITDLITAGASMFVGALIGTLIGTLIFSLVTRDGGAWKP